MSVERPIHRFDPHPVAGVDRLAEEQPLELRIGGVPVAVLMSTPAMEAELALGFALTEGILLSPTELAEVVRSGEGDRFDLVLAPGVSIDPEQFRRNTYTTSSCGVCGKASIDAVRVAARPLPPGPILTPGLISSLPGRLSQAQPGFDATGGLHAAVLFSPEGDLLASAEDVGRHNAVDKTIGKLARKRWPFGEIVLAVSGRVSFEIVQKAAVVGIPMVVGVSAATSLAVDLAAELGLTLIGFARGESFVTYAGLERVADSYQIHTAATRSPLPPGVIIPSSVDRS